MTASYDLATLGEALLRLSVPSPGRFETAPSLDVQLGGAEANVAAAGARLGLRTAWVSAVPDNPWGERVSRELTGHGVDCRFVRRLPDARLGVYFLEFGVAPRPIRVLYDRRESAFSRLTVDAVDWEPFRRARVVHLTGVTAALGDNAQALVRRAAAEAPALSYDVNYRATLWSPEAARAFADSLLPRVSHLFLGQAEAQTVFGLDRSPEAVVETLARRWELASVTLLQGQEGSVTLAEGRLWRPSRRPAVHMVDPIGAGDAFVAGFLWARLGGQGLQEAVDAGTAVAALKCSIWGDIARIGPRDVEEALAGGPEVRR